MQKFTIFTIIFSVIVISITTELVIQDYLQKLYPPASTLQTNTLNDDFGVFYEDDTPVEPKTEEQPVETEEEPAEQPSEEELKDRTERVKEILDRRRGVEEDPEEDKGINSSVRVRTLLPALSIEGVQLKNLNYPGKMFQIIETESLDAAEIAYGVFQLESGTIGSMYELRFRNELRAEEAYTLIKAQAASFEGIETNETDQFGESSFYINNIVKVNEVFVVFHQDNYIYAFAYKKDYHEVFKAFFAVLV